MEPIAAITSKIVVLDREDIDTDQIIPARFLTTTTREGLGQHAFTDWRYNPDGSINADFVLNRPENAGAQILVAGNNFGCGSSREHAPWALLDFGIRAVISTEIADIFRSNSLKNGLVPVVVPEAVLGQLMADPGQTVTIDLEATELKLGDGSTVTFPIDRFARYCLMNGVDQLGYLLQQDEAISRYEAERAWPI